MDVFTCIDCEVEFLYDESPSDERCAECACRWAHNLEDIEGAA